MFTEWSSWRVTYNRALVVLNDPSVFHHQRVQSGHVLQILSPTDTRSHYGDRKPRQRDSSSSQGHDRQSVLSFRLPFGLPACCSRAPPLTGTESQQGRRFVRFLEGRVWYWQALRRGPRLAWPGGCCGRRVWEREGRAVPSGPLGVSCIIAAVCP